MGFFKFGKKKNETNKELAYTQPEEVDLPNLPSDFSSDTLADLPEFPEKTERDKQKMDDLETLPVEEDIEESKQPFVQSEKQEHTAEDFFSGLENNDEEKMSEPVLPMDTEKILPMETKPATMPIPEPSKSPQPVMQEPVAALLKKKSTFLSSETDYAKQERKGLSKIGGEHFLDAETFSDVTNTLAELQISSRRMKNKTHWNELTEKEAELLDALEDTADAVQKKLVSTDSLLTKR